jgi:uncharacterized protein (DUF2147 family)
MSRLKKIMIKALFLFCVIANVTVISGTPLNNTIIAQAAAKTKLSKTSVSIEKGKKYTLKLKNVQKGKKAKWSTSNKKVATIKANGNSVVITGKKAGTAKVTAKVNGKTYTCKVTVKVTQTSEQTAFIKLKTYVLQYGAINDQGNYAIQTDWTSDQNDEVTWCIIYESKSGKIDFYMYREGYTGSIIAVDMYLANQNGAYAECEYFYYEDDESITLTSRLLPSTYTGKENIYFTAKEVYGYFSASFRQSSSNAALRLAFVGWGGLLEDTGVEFKDLGFTKLSL